MRVPTGVRNFPGGLSLDHHKEVSRAQPLRVCALPERLILPLKQHRGSPAHPCVEPGDRVLAGEPLALAGEGLSASIHAPTSGTVLAIEPHPTPQPPFTPEPSIVIAPDGLDRWRKLAPIPRPLEAPAERLIARIAEAGVVGLGGAVFPTAEKLAVPRELLIVNGAECEPYIACDDALLRARAHSVVQGARIAARAVGANRILIAVEDHMQAAHAALARALSEIIGPPAPAGHTLHFEEREGEGRWLSLPIDLVQVPSRYPQGGERQLIYALTGREVPLGGLPRDIGVAVINVGTAAAILDAVVHGEALVSRVVTVTGGGVRRPGNYQVRLGTPIETLIAFAGGYREDAARLIVGGPLMGLALPHDAFPVTKATNCILVLAASELARPEPELPCIRCMACAEVCPARLLPQELLRRVRARQWPEAESAGLSACIECGCCDLVCPSHIPLADWFRFGKGELGARAEEERRAREAKRRHEERQARLAREAAEREARRREQTERLADPAAVSSLIAQARARRDQTPPE